MVGWFVYVRACVRVRVRACVRVCVCVCVHARARVKGNTSSFDVVSVHAASVKNAEVRQRAGR